MKRQSFLNPKGYRNRGLLSSPVGIAGGVLIFVIALLLVLRLAAPSALVAISSPFWKAGSSLTAAVGNSSEQFEGKGALLKERDALATQNATLTAENASLAAQDHDLQTLLGSRTAPPADIVAGVLSRPPVSPYDVLVVDQGGADGVGIGAHAYGDGGTPLGVVENVTDHTARITLYSNPSMATDAWMGDSRIPFTIIGAGAGAFTSTVSKDAGAIVGMGVYVSGPGALPIGSIVKIDSDPSSPNVVLHIRPYANPFSLTWVTIAAGV